MDHFRPWAINLSPKWALDFDLKVRLFFVVCVGESASSCVCVRQISEAFVNLFCCGEDKWPIEADTDLWKFFLLMPV